MVEPQNVNEKYIKVLDNIREEIINRTSSTAVGGTFPSTYRVIDCYIDFDLNTVQNGLRLIDPHTFKQGIISVGDHVFFATVIASRAITVSGGSVTVDIGLSEDPYNETAPVVNKVIVNNLVIDSLNPSSGINYIPNTVPPFIADGVDQYLTLDIIAGSGTVVSGQLRFVVMLL